MMMALALACLPIVGERVLARDFGSLWPEMAALGDAPAGFAPLPGARRFFSVAELARLAARHGLAAPKSEICFEYPVRRITAGEIAAAMQPLFPGARITVREFGRYPAPPGDLVFPREALRPDGTWRGWVPYGRNRRFPVWARVEIRQTARRVRALGRLAAGRPIPASQLHEETAEVAPSAGRFAEDATDVAGRKPRGAIPEGAFIRLDLLQEPLDIEPGDQVTVRVESGAAHLSLTGRAETGGRAGDTIRVRNPESRRVFAALVEAKARAVVKSR